MISKNLKHKRVLFLEDNVSFAEHTIQFLELYVKEVIHCTSMKKAYEVFEDEHLDCIFTDLKVDDGIALNFIEKIRQVNLTIPIIVMSAHKDESFLLKSIPLGLTSYELKPINFEKFKSILEKCSEVIERNNEKIVHIKDNIYYDYNRKLILKDDESIILSKKESVFIELLIENKNGVISKEKISEVVWENDIMSESALKNFLLRVRKKIAKKLFYTIQNVGYRL